MNKIVIILAAILLTASVFAQSPQKMSYQAVIRNSSDALVKNQTVGMQISILQGSPTGTAVYIETQTPSTNDNGLVSIEIGAGTIFSGVFSTIDWANDIFFIKTEIDPAGGTSYSITGTSQLLSVPYALHAKTAETISGGVTETDPVFGAWDKDYDDLTNKPAIPIVPATVSSFTNDAGYLTSFTEVDGSVTNELQALSMSNDTIYLSNGGFVKISNVVWSLSGNSSTDDPSNFIGTTDNVPLNIRVNNVRSGRIESFYGQTFLGYSAGLNNNTNASGNTGIGHFALSGNTTGIWNTAVGRGSLLSSTIGTHNTAIGGVGLQSNINGNANTSVGYGSLLENISGNENAALGMYALKSNKGNFNTALGYESGYNMSNGSSNVFLGYKAGYNETGSNKLYIANSSTNPPLIYGDFSTRTVSLGTITPNTSVPLYVYGFGSNDGRIATFQGPQDEKYITIGNVTVDQGGYLKYKSSSNYTGIGVHGHTERIVILGTGNIGIGTTTPSTTLDVAGAIKIADGTQAAGKVLTSDANGLASWQTPQSYTAGNGIAINGNTISTNNDFYLGQDTLGGIVFYIYSDQNGEQHGLIVSKTETTAQWQSSTSTTNATRTWDGAYNMGLMTNSPAKTWVTGLGVDWYLPSIDELSILWQNRFHANKGLNDAGATLLSNYTVYWSSTEYDTESACYFWFSNGSAGGATKSTTDSVRAVRTF